LAGFLEREITGNLRDSAKRQRRAREASEVACRRSSERPRLWAEKADDLESAQANAATPARRLDLLRLVE